MSEKTFRLCFDNDLADLSDRDHKFQKDRVRTV